MAIDLGGARRLGLLVVVVVVDVVAVVDAAPPMLADGFVVDAVVVKPDGVFLEEAGTASL